jgi:hypothetical protein
MGRPRKQVDPIEILKLRLEGYTWPLIARKLNCGLGTVYRAGTLPLRRANAAKSKAA